MSFQPCAACGHQLHVSALACPNCGAPTAGAAAFTPTTTAAVPGEPSAYSQVPWYRRRWANVLAVLTIPPLSAVVAATGPINYLAKGEVKTLPKNYHTGLYLLSGLFVLQLFSEPGSSRQLWVAVGQIIAAIAIGVKK